MKRILALLLVLLTLALAGCESGAGLPGGGTTTKPAAPAESGKAVEQPAPAKIKTVDFVVYRVPKNGNLKLLPEKVHYAIGDKTMAEGALQALVKTEPTSKTMQNLFPAGTVVKSVKVKDGIAYADFNQAFAKRGQGSYNEMMMVNAIVATLTELPEIKKVQILVEGKKIATISGHMDLLDPLPRNKTLL